MMPCNWHKRGLLIAAPTPQTWAYSHAALPVADELDDGQIDVYYSPRDEACRAHIAVARVQTSENDDALTVAAHEPDPILSPGALGAFDDSGVTMSCLVHTDSGTFLYYTGWTLGVSVPFYFYVGLAIRRPGESAFERVSRAPILERDAVDPYLTASPWVLREKGTWRMWYVSCVDWKVVDGEASHRYHIRYAESDDGVAWRRDGRVSVDFADGSEYAMGRPCVVRDGDRYRMWFAARGKEYRLAYAESLDGVDWIRNDELVGLDPSPESWDAEMLAYPSILDHGGRRYLLYNGNGYGRTGVGYAVAETVDPSAIGELRSRNNEF
jgi:hypothetical protein